MECGGGVSCGWMHPRLQDGTRKEERSRKGKWGRGSPHLDEYCGRRPIPEGEGGRARVTGPLY